MKFEAAWHRTKANYGQVSISHRAHLPAPLQHHWRALTKLSQAARRARGVGGGVPDVRSCHFRPCFGSKCDGDLIILLGFDLSCAAGAVVPS